MVFISLSVCVEVVNYTWTFSLHYILIHTVQAHMKKFIHTKCTIDEQSRIAYICQFCVQSNIN